MPTNALPETITGALPDRWSVNALAAVSSSTRIVYRPAFSDETFFPLKVRVSLPVVLTPPASAPRKEATFEPTASVFLTVPCEIVLPPELVLDEGELVAAAVSVPGPEVLKTTRPLAGFRSSAKV